MKIRNEKALFYLIFGLLIIIILFQLFKLKDNLSMQKKLNYQLEKQQLKTSALKNNYRIKGSNSNSNELKNRAFKNNTAQILDRLKTFNLDLIDFSSNKAELNLNINGDFHSLLKLLYYLENEMSGIKIEELKLKSSNNKLFFYIRIRDELI